MLNILTLWRSRSVLLLFSCCFFWYAQHRYHTFPYLRKPQTTGLAKDKARALQIGELDQWAKKWLKDLLLSWREKCVLRGRRLNFIPKYCPQKLQHIKLQENDAVCIQTFCFNNFPLLLWIRFCLFIFVFFKKRLRSVCIILTLISENKSIANINPVILPSKHRW